MEQTNEGGESAAAGQVTVATQPLGGAELGGVPGDQRQIQAAATSSEADGSRITHPNNDLQANRNPGSAPPGEAAVPPRPDVELVVENVWLPYSGGRAMIEFAAGLTDLSMENFEV